MPGPALLSEERGSVYFEYLVVLCLVCVGAALALATCGVLLLKYFYFQQTVILLPFP